jgi:hypothetical protein
MKKDLPNWCYTFKNGEYQIEYDSFGYLGTTHKAARRHAGNKNRKARWEKEGRGNDA